MMYVKCMRCVCNHVILTRQIKQNTLPDICEAVVARWRLRGKGEGQKALPQGNGSARMLAAVC